MGVHPTILSIARVEIFFYIFPGHLTVDSPPTSDLRIFRRPQTSDLRKSDTPPSSDLRKSDTPL